MEKINSTNNIELNIGVPSVREINLETAMNLQKNGTLFVDARSEEYLEDGFIPGAINNDDTDVLSDEIATLIGFDKGFVIYCSDDDCGSSEDLAYDLQEYGFNNILVFKGGWKTWSESGLDIDYNE
jgi:rhodanese-related sulfurtransferase